MDYEFSMIGERKQVNYSREKYRLRKQNPSEKEANWSKLIGEKF